MQIEEGKFYKNRVGDKVGPMILKPNYKGSYKWHSSDYVDYLDCGSFISPIEPDDKDLIEEWEEPATLPPATEADEGWGPWNEGRMPYQPASTWTTDYREECINGVWRWQSRPRKPVVEKFVKYLAPKPYQVRGNFKHEIYNTIGTDVTHKISFNTIDGVIDCSSVKMEPL